MKLRIKEDQVKSGEDSRSFVSTALKLLEEEGLLKGITSMDEVVDLIKREFDYDCTTDLVEDIYHESMDRLDRQLLYKNLGLYYPDIHDNIV